MASWDKRYERDDYLFGTEPAMFLQRETMRLEAGQRALCIADGEGRNSVFLAARGLTVTAFDPSAVALAKARRLAEARAVDVEFRQSTVEDWNWTPGAFDVAVAIFIQFAAPALRAEIFRGMDRTLRPGGMLLIHGYAERQVGYGTGGPPNPENMYDLLMLREAFPGYRVLHADDYDTEIREGEGHSGISGLIDFVAVKPEG
jgi:cyclopropane fatty-acyl-phospholipid synthase-like methyltransferase